MNIYFVSIGHRPCALYASRSFAKYGTVIQITDKYTLPSPYADKVIRSHYDEQGMMKFIIEEYSKITDDVFITMDDDCILNGPFEDALEGEYDIALVKRHKAKIDKDRNNLTKRLPYQKGFVVIKNSQFYKDCLENFYTLPDDLWWWFGDMVCMRNVIDSGKYRVKYLDPHRYFRTPTEVGQGDDSAVVWHYSGEIRKQWMRYHGQSNIAS